MVDAIIKSARAEALAAAPAQPLQNTAAPATASAAAPTTAVKPTIPEALRVQTPPDVKEAIAQSSAARAAGGAAGGSGLKDAFSSKSLLSSIVNNYNNALKSGNNSVHGVGGSASNAVGLSAPVSAAPVVGAQTPVAPTAAPSVLRDITASATKPQQASAPAASTPAAAAPIAAAAPPTPAAPVVKEKEYIIEDRYTALHGAYISLTLTVYGS
jgi:2-oxoglutarate dehydrogenase E2 component (dihydrolipoamide succinyltransferase)